MAWNTNSFPVGPLHRHTGLNRMAFEVTGSGGLITRIAQLDGVMRLGSSPTFIIQPGRDAYSVYEDVKRTAREHLDGES